MTTNIKIQHKTWLDISKLDYFYYISKMQSHSILALLDGNVTGRVDKYLGR